MEVHVFIVFLVKHISIYSGHCLICCFPSVFLSKNMSDVNLEPLEVDGPAAKPLLTSEARDVF